MPKEFYQIRNNEFFVKHQERLAVFNGYGRSTSASTTYVLK